MDDTNPSRPAAVPGRRALIAAAAALALPTSAMAQAARPAPGAVLPQLQATDTEGRAIPLPSGLPAARSVVIVTQKKEHSPIRTAWAEAVGQVPLLDLALFDDYGALFRGMVRDAMREGVTDPVARARVALVFGGRADVRRHLGIEGEELVHVLVVDRATGGILGRASGTPDAAAVAGLRRALG